MQRKWVLILGRILIFLGFIFLISNVVFNYLSSVNGTEPGFTTQIDALSFLLPGIILVGFNRILNKLDELKNERVVKSSYDFQERDEHRDKKDRQIITSDEQLKDYKYVTRK